MSIVVEIPDPLATQVAAAARIVALGYPCCSTSGATPQPCRPELT